MSKYIKKEEIELFRAAMQGVEPMHTDKARRDSIPNPTVKKAEIAIKASTPAPTILDVPNYASTDYGVHDTIEFIRDSYSKSVLKKLKKGFFPIQSHLDLHHLNPEQAAYALEKFIQKCTEQKLVAAKIIHGRGWNSPDQKSLLKNYLYQWLPEFPSVVAFCSARERDGGAGAVYVLFQDF